MIDIGRSNSLFLNTFNLFGFFLFLNCNLNKRDRDVDQFQMIKNQFEIDLSLSGSLMELADSSVRYGLAGKSLLYSHFEITNNNSLIGLKQDYLNVRKRVCQILVKFCGIDFAKQKSPVLKKAVYLLFCQMRSRAFKKYVDVRSAVGGVLLDELNTWDVDFTCGPSTSDNFNFEKFFDVVV